MTEKQLHKSICDYLKAQYKDVLFNTDMSGIKLTTGQATQAKNLRSNNGFPDIVIYEISLGMYHALFLEVKKETPYKKDGELKKMIRYEHINGIKVPYDHLRQQDEIHQRLRIKGFKAEFAWSFDMAKDIIDEYLK